MALLGEFEVAARQVDGTQEPDQFKFCGELFTVGEVGVVPLGRFAKAAAAGTAAAEMEGLAALVDMLSDVVIDEDRQRFLDTATRHRAKSDDLMPIVTAIIQAEIGRPTQQPSGSSGGLSTTGASSKASSPFGPAVSPIMMDPRVQELQSLEQVALSLVV